MVLKISSQSPKERYDHDPAYRRMTDLMESMLVAYQFTPSEMREMAIMACMHFEMRYGMRNYFQSVPYKVNEAFKQLEDFRATSMAEREKLEQERKDIDAKAAAEALGLAESQENLLQDDDGNRPNGDDKTGGS